MKKAIGIGAFLVVIVGVLVIFPIGEWIEAGRSARGAWAPPASSSSRPSMPSARCSRCRARRSPWSRAAPSGSGRRERWRSGSEPPPGLAIAFLAARKLARDRVARWLAAKPSFAAVDRAVAAEGWKIVLLTRLTPIFPFTFLNYAYGVTAVSFPAYAVASAVGILPGSLFYIYLGSSVAQTISGQVEQVELLLRIFGVAAFALVTILITRIARRALRDAGVGTSSKD